MPSRMIHPSALHSASLAKLSDAAERLWWRLLTTTDSCGLFDADPRIVRGVCAPLLQWDDSQVAALLSELVAIGSIRLYQRGERFFGQVINFSNHNKIYRHAPKHPTPDDPGVRDIEDLPIPYPYPMDRVSIPYTYPQNNGLSSSLVFVSSSKPQTRDPSSTESATAPTTTPATTTKQAVEEPPDTWPGKKLAAEWSTEHKVAASRLPQWWTALRRLENEHGWPAVARLVAWVRADEFWARNCRSPLKLLKRDKEGVLWWDRLWQEMQRATKPSATGPRRLDTPDDRAAADPDEAARLAEFRARYQ